MSKPISIGAARGEQTVPVSLVPSPPPVQPGLRLRKF